MSVTQPLTYGDYDDQNCIAKAGTGAADSKQTLDAFTKTIGFTPNTLVTFAQSPIANDELLDYVDTLKLRELYLAWCGENGFEPIADQPPSRYRSALGFQHRLVAGL